MPDTGGQSRFVTWRGAIRLVAVFFPVPFAALLWRPHTDARHSCLVGVVLVALVAAPVAPERAGAARRDAARERARRARANAGAGDPPPTPPARRP